MWKKLSSGKKIASGVICDGPCLYFGFVCLPGGVNRTVTLYDELTATGNEVEDFIANANLPSDGHSHSNPVVCSKGLYLALGGGSVVVYYAPYNMNT